MNKFISQIFKGAGVDAKVSKDAKNPKFKVRKDMLTLEGIVKPNKYIMKITDNTGKEIDALSVSISNSNDIVNRINESISTLQMLSKVYDKEKLIEEDEEYDTVSADDEDEVEDAPSSLEDGLTALYDDVMDIAERAQDLTNMVTDDNPETINDIISITSGLYDCAIDIDEMKEDLFEIEDEDIDESLNRQKVSKGHIHSVLSNLTIVESLLRKNKELKDIYTAVKDIKSELIVRGYK